MHIWTFLTMVPSSFDTISASSFSLSQSSFRLNKTFPCHGTLKVVNMCMSNTMNMDVTSFFGAWPPACPHAGSPHPESPQAQDTTSEWAQHAEETHRHTQRSDATTISGTPTHISVYVSPRQANAPALVLSLLPVCLSSLTFHSVFYVKIKDREEGKY